jgi:MtrB/PioB family decaheme-associated outer membrane protein
MRKIDRSTKNLLAKSFIASVALALAGPGVVLAEPMFQVPLTRGADMSRYDSDYVEIGGGYQSNDSYKFGEFSGLVDEGGFVIGNFNARKRFGDDAGYVNAWGYNLGQTSRQMGIEGGQQGKYWLNAGYDQLTRYQYDDTYFIHNGLGGSYLTLPGGFTGITAGGNQPPANAAAINPYLTNFKIKQERDVLNLGGGFFAGTNWKFSANYREDDLNGNKLIGAVMGNTGGNPRAAILPYELDGKIQQFDVRASWLGKQGQFNLTYWYSKYDNSAESLTWQNPYGNAWGAACNPGAGGCAFPTGYGRLGLMPSNDAWNLQATGAWNFTPTMRLTSTLAYGVMNQNEAFLPYTINGPAYPGGPTQTAGTNLAVNTALPRGSLDGQIKNTLFDLTYTWRPMSKLSLKAQYHYNKRDNNTPQNWYSYIGGDTTNQVAIPPGTNPTTIADTHIRMNVPPGQVENRFKIDGDYQIFSRTLLRGWYQYTRINYEEASEELRSDTTNNQFGVELRRIMSETFTGAAKYVYDQRRGSYFSTFVPYAASYTNATTSANQLDNIPTTRQFLVADYDKNLVQFTGSWSPLERTTFGMRADYYKMDFKGPNCGGQTAIVGATTFTYPDQCLGRNSADGSSFTLDGSYSPADGWNTFAFYTYQKYGTQQNSRSFNNAAASVLTDNNWGVNMDYSDNTFGLGVNFKPAGKQWDAGALYTYNNGTGTYSYIPGPNTAPIIPVPDTTYKSNQFQLFAKYQYSKNLLFRFNYWYQNARSSDWAYDGIAPASSNNALFTGQQSPNYHENVFGFSVAYTGW